jgi:hypothetical protein
MYGLGAPNVTQGFGNTAFAYILPTNRPNEATCSNPYAITCTQKAWTALFYLNYQFSPLDNISLRSEYFDVTGWRTGFATAYNEWTLGWQHWLSPQVELRPEIAWYHSLDEPAFEQRHQTCHHGCLGGRDLALLAGTIPSKDQRSSRTTVGPRSKRSRPLTCITEALAARQTCPGQFCGAMICCILWQITV